MNVYEGEFLIVICLFALKCHPPGGPAPVMGRMENVTLKCATLIKCFSCT